MPALEPHFLFMFQKEQKTPNLPFWKPFFKEMLIQCFCEFLQSNSKLWHCFLGYSLFSVCYIGQEFKEVLYCCSCLVAKSWLTLGDPVESIPPGSSVHGILQARILEWVAISFSRGSSGPRDQTCTSLCLLHWQADSLPLRRLGSPGTILSEVKWSRSVVSDSLWPHGL